MENSQRPDHRPLGATPSPLAGGGHTYSTGRFAGTVPFGSEGVCRCATRVERVDDRSLGAATAQERVLGYGWEIHAAHRYDSDGAFPLNVPHLRLETGHLPAEVAAQRIVKHFGL